MSTLYHSDEEAQLREEPQETVHIYIVREQAEATIPIVDADPLPDDGQEAAPKGVLPYSARGSRWFCLSLLFLLPFLLGGSSTVVTTLLRQTLTLTLSLHPTATQVQLSPLPEVMKSAQITVPATGLLHQDEMKAEGLITFYNGLFVPQTVPAGTTLTGNDGITVVTQEQVTIPPATATTPPIYGVAVVSAVSTTPGTTGNIPAGEINQPCCGGSLLAHNLTAFTGGRNAQDVPVVQESDIQSAAMTLKAELYQAVNSQARSAQQPGEQLLPLTCTNTTSADRNAGDQVSKVTVTLSEQCIPLAYSLAEVQKAVVALLRPLVASADTITGVSVLVLAASTTDPQSGGGVLTIAVSAQIQRIQG
jgi:hypothetical protein